MKKVLTILCITALLITLSACGTNTKNDGAAIRIGGLKGPTSIGLVKLLEDAKEGKTQNPYDFTMAVTADELTPKFLKGELDILAVPANLGSILYNKMLTSGAGDGVEFIAVSTLGVVYIVEKGGQSIQSVADLKGRTIYATGKGTTPEFTLSYLLKSAGLDLNTDVTVEWKSEPTEVVAQMALQEHAIAMIPQPFVTVAQGQLSDLRIALNLSEEWDKVGGDSRAITAGLIVRRKFAKEHAGAVRNFLKDYSASVNYVNQNPKEASVLVENLGIVKAAVAEKAIPFCHLVCITGEEMMRATEGYLTVLYNMNPQSVGGGLPGDDFYEFK